MSTLTMDREGAQPTEARRRPWRPTALVSLLTAAVVAGTAVWGAAGGGLPGTREASPAPSAAGSPAPPASPAPRAPGQAPAVFTTPVPDDPRLDPASEQMVAHLSAKAPMANFGEFGFPVYEADADTPRYDVRCTREWGVCALETHGPVPVPDGAEPSWGSDGAMAVVDREAGLSYEFWQARREDGTWVASWGDVADLDEAAASPSAATGAGLSILDGLVTPEEVAAGVMPHALTFSTDNACTEHFREPATKTDGSSERPDCVPEGARVQLDPAVDLDALPSLTPVDRAIGQALQTYGAYVRDNGGHTIAFSLQTPSTDEEHAAYLDAGLVEGYTVLESLPWDRLRVLQRWDGG